MAYTFGMGNIILYPISSSNNLLRRQKEMKFVSDPNNFASICEVVGFTVIIVADTLGLFWIGYKVIKVIKAKREYNMALRALKMAEAKEKGLITQDWDKSWKLVK